MTAPAACQARCAITASWLWTGDELIPGGGVRVEDGVVTELLRGRDAASASRGAADEPHLDFPGGLIHPGLVDAHCHLDLSDTPLVPAGATFPDWLERVRAARLDVPPEHLKGAARRGLERRLADGVVGVIDFSFDAVSRDALSESAARVVLLREVLGLSDDRAAAALEAARVWLESIDTSAAPRAGLAPHAPYSAAGSLIRECKRLCVSSSPPRPLAIHVAEDPAEATFLLTGRGPFRDFLERLGVPLEGFAAPGCRPLELLDRLGTLDEDTLLIHANDLSDDEIDRIGASGAAVVFCPGTHCHFARPDHPLPKLLERGVPVALGTDSPASSAAPSVAADMRCVRAMFPELPARVVWRLGTGAALTRLLPGVGRLAPRGRADLTVSLLTEQRPAGADGPLEAFLVAEATNALTVCGGRIVFGASRAR